MTEQLFGRGGSEDAFRSGGATSQGDFVYRIRADDVNYACAYLGTLSDPNDILPIDLVHYEKIFTEGTQLLSVACFYGAVQVAEAVISLGASVNCHDSQSRTPIHFAAAGGHRHIIRMLGSYGANLLELDHQRRSFIHYATLFNRVEILEYGRASGFDLDAPSRMGHPIHIACRYGHFRVIELLLRDRGQVDVNRVFMGRLPVFHLFDSCRLEALPLLVHAGLQLNKPGLGAWPPLFYAVRTGHANIVAQLLRYGADPNVTGKGEWTPLHVAAQTHCKKVLEELLLWGAHPHRLTEYDQSPFSLSRGGTPRDREMEVPRFLREWLVDCFARAIIIGFARKEMSEEMFRIGYVSKAKDAKAERDSHRGPSED
jgi:ankyrin repeat protein